MIITEEFLNEIKCCKDGIAFGQHFNLLGKDHIEILEFLKENNHTHPYEWLKEVIRSYRAIIYRGNYIVKSYHVFNPLTGIYEIADTEENAVILKNRIINDYVEAHVLQLIDTKREIVEPDGTSALQNWEIK